MCNIRKYFSYHPTANTYFLLTADVADRISIADHRALKTPEIQVY